MIAFTVPGPPQPWRRARLNKQGGHYTDARTRANKSAWAAAYIDACEGVPRVLDGPLRVSVLASFAIPKRATKQQRQDMLSGVVQPTGRPDADNILKNVDGLNGVAWKDDSQITSALVVKRYAEEAGVHVVVSPA